MFRRVGGRVLWSGTPEAVAIGPADERRNAAFVAHPPTAVAFLEILADLAYHAAVVHRPAAVATSRPIRCAARHPGNGFG